MTSLKKLLFSFLLLVPFLTFSQEVIEETFFVDTSEVVYQVIHKETIGEYFQLKRYVFADDTATVAIEKNFSNGHQNGLTRIYYPAGKLRVKALYGNDKFQGEWTLFREDGIIHTKGVYSLGIKHGYWAYKEDGIYGRYKKGKRNGKWIKKGANGNKYKGWYSDGEFKRGAKIIKDNHVDSLYNVGSDSNLVIVTPKLEVDEKYMNVIKYLKGSYYLRKTTKDYFRPNKKLRKTFVDENVDYDKDVLNFQVSSILFPIDISYFIEKKKLIKPKLNDLIKSNGDSINKGLLSFTEEEVKDLTELSTDKEAKLIFCFSKLTDKLVALEIIENENLGAKDFSQIHAVKSNVRMKVLVLLDENNEVLEVEYQQREW